MHFVFFLKKTNKYNHSNTLFQINETTIFYLIRKQYGDLKIIFRKNNWTIY